MAKKKVAAVVKIQIPAGKATPAPPVGTALGPHGVAIMDFCKAYNAADRGPDGARSCPSRSPSSRTARSRSSSRRRRRRCCCAQAAGLDKGSETPGKDVAGTVTDAQVAEIAKIKMPDLNANDLEAAKQQVAGTARSMGIDGQLTATPTSATGTTSPGGHDHQREPSWRRARSTTTQPKRFDRDQLLHAAEAIELVKDLRRRKFDETVELAVRLGVDPRKADQMVRGTVALPSGTGKDVRVAVFAAGDAAAEARAAGADFVGADDLAAQVEGGMLDFDVAIATPDLMPLVGRLGRVLGPRGLMPNPKTGTVTTDVGKAVGEFKGGKVEYRTDRYGNVHVPIGKASFDPEALLDELRRRARRAAAGQARLGQGPLPEAHRRVVDHGPGHQDRFRPHRDPRTPRPLTERESRARGQRRRAGRGRSTRPSGIDSASVGRSSCWLRSVTTRSAWWSPRSASP